MAHFDLNEQEQIENVKYFWKDWGKYIVLLVVVLIIGYVGNSLYTWYQGSHAKDAANVYAEFTSALKAKDNVKVLKTADQLVAQMPKTEYAALASLQAAKVAFDQKNYAAAEKYLSWVLNNAKDKSLQSVAAIRLSSVYIDQKKFDKAREVLRTKHDIAFDGLFYENRGDLYVAMDDLPKARDSYKEGLQKSANDPSTQQAIQMKLDILGG